MKEDLILQEIKGINQRLDEVNERIDGVNQKMEEGFADIQEKISVIPDMQRKIEVIPDILEKISVIPDMQKKIEVIPDMQKKIEVIPKMQKDIETMKEEIHKISKTVAVIEVEHGEKLEALFDAFSMHSEKIQSHEERIRFCETHLDRHDDEIYYLNSKI